MSDCPKTTRCIMFLRKTPKVFYVVSLIWILIAYNILNRWELINSKGFFSLELNIYLFIFIAVIWGIIWSIRSNSIKTKKSILLFSSIIAAAVITYSNFADTAKLYLDFAINYHERKEVAEKLVKNFKQSPKTEKHPDSLIFLGEKYKSLSTDGYVHIWTDRGCIEVDFQVYDGRHESYLDFFCYGKSGHITYVTENENYNLKGGTIQKHVIATKKIFNNWYFVQTKQPPKKPL